jgi:hypothetical protein
MVLSQILSSSSDLMNPKSPLSLYFSKRLYVASAVLTTGQMGYWPGPPRFKGPRNGREFVVVKGGFNLFSIVVLFSLKTPNHQHYHNKYWQDVGPYRNELAL